MARYAVIGPDSIKSLADRSGLETKIQALQSLDARLDLLFEATRRLGDDAQGSLLSRRAVVSGGAEFVTATALPQAPMVSHRIVVEELACAHHIASDALPAARSVIPAGPYRFAVGASDRMTVFEVQVETSDVDADVVHAVAAAIEASGTGLAVQLEYGTGEHGDEFVRLHLSSRATGKRAALVTADQSRNLMVLLGLAASGYAGDRNGGTVTKARDAVFQVDGVRRTAPANRVYLEEERLFLALHAVGEATLTIRPDLPSIVEVLGDWVGALGDVLALASQPSVRALLDPPADLLGTVNSLRGALESCGIRLHDGRTLELLPDVIASALDEDIEAFFSRLAAPDSGLARVVLVAAEKEIADSRQASAALQRQVDWYRQVPNPLAARRLARQVVAAYAPSLFRIARTE